MSNVFSFTGQLGRDCEVKTLPSGHTICNFSAANNVGFGDRQQTLWIRCAIWGKRAEGKLPDFLKKGTQVFVSGELSQSEYQANDGTTKSTLELNVNIVDLVGGKSKGDSQGQSQAPAQQPGAPVTDDFDDNLDDVPF